MLCCLCLTDAVNIAHIFEDNEVEDKTNIAAIVAKHFWFEPLKDDPIFTAICKICWAKLYDFHEFYEMVEVAHQRHNMERVTVKTEAAAIVDFSSLPSKNEPNDDFGELDEVPFSTEEGQSPFNGVDSDENYIDGISELVTFQNKSEDSDPFNGTGDTTKEVPVKSEPLESIDNGKIEKNASTNLSESEDTGTVNDEIVTEPFKKRTRSENKKPVPKDKQPKLKKQINKSPEEESEYKRKMKSFDDEISQYMGLHCDVCNVPAENFAGIKGHMRKEHNIDNGYVKCCDKKFLKRANLLHHIRHHVNPNCYRCEECDQTFSDHQSLHNHNNIKHQKEEDKIYECTECPKKFARKYLLEQHKTFKHKDRFKQCKTCNRRYKTLEELAEHNKEPCAGGRMCDICAKVIFGGPSAFKRHQLEHQDGDAHKVQCDMCGSWHKDKYALRKHKRRHLQPKTPHTCDICHKISPSRDAMESHKKYAHRSDRNFECEFCKKSFKRPRSLREHISTHTGAFLYTCPHCPKTFNSNANMYLHRKNVHPVEFEEARQRRNRVWVFNPK